MGYNRVINSALIRSKDRLYNFRHLDLIFSNSPHANMQQGTIARLTDKGFGFIKIDGQEKDLFFHSNEVVGTTFDALREGDQVSFEVGEGPKGPNALKVSKI